MTCCRMTATCAFISATCFCKSAISRRAATRSPQPALTPAWSLAGVARRGRWGLPLTLLASFPVINRSCALFPAAVFACPTGTPKASKGCRAVLPITNFAGGQENGGLQHQDERAPRRAQGPVCPSCSTWIRTCHRCASSATSAVRPSTADVYRSSNGCRSQDVATWGIAGLERRKTSFLCDHVSRRPPAPRCVSPDAA